MKFVQISSKRTYVFVQDKKNLNLRSYNIIESWSGEVFWVINIIIIEFRCYSSLVSLSEINIWSNSAADKLTTSI